MASRGTLPESFRETGSLPIQGRGAVCRPLVSCAVFPANLHMALHPEDYRELPGGAPALWARLPLQAVFIAWVRSAMRRP